MNRRQFFGASGVAVIPLVPALTECQHMPVVKFRETGSIISEDVLPYAKKYIEYTKDFEYTFPTGVRIGKVKYSIRKVKVWVCEKDATDRHITFLPSGDYQDSYGCKLWGEMILYAKYRDGEFYSLWLAASDETHVKYTTKNR